MGSMPPPSTMTTTSVCVFVYMLWLGWHMAHTHTHAHSHLVQISNAQRGSDVQREIHARRRPILRVVRLINGFLREFAIYYLAATAASHSLCVKEHRFGLKWNDEKKRREKNYQLFSLWFTVARVRPYISAHTWRMKKRTVQKLGWSSLPSSTLARSPLLLVVGEWIAALTPKQ